MLTNWHEVPPTAGLPIQWRDWLPASTDFATALSTALGIPSPQLECSGTAALVVALTAFRRFSERRTVIVPAYTCPLVAIAIAHCGLDILLCDLAPDSVDLDMVQLEALLQRSDVLAVIPTHLAGRVVDVATVKGLASPRGVFVLEDAAQAVGATFNGESVGLCGDAGFFSFAIGKGLSTYEGGALFTRDEQLRAAFRQAQQQVIRTDVWMEILRSLQLLGATLLYNPIGLRFAYGTPFRRALARNDWMSAAGDDFSMQIPLHPLGKWRQQVGANALPRLPAFLAAARSQANRRVEQLQAIKGVCVMQDTAGTKAQGTWPMLLLQMASMSQRDEVLRLLAKEGLGVSRLFVHELQSYSYLRPVLVEQAGTQFANAHHFAATTFSISNSLWLDDARFDKILSVVRAVLTP